MMVKKTHRGHIPRIAIGILALIIVTAAYTGVAGAQRGDICLGCDPKTQNATSLQASATSLQASHYGSSPFAPPQNNDHTFVVDKGPGLDTGCTFRSEGPLVFTIDVGRYPGNLDKLIENGLIEKTAELKMPAYDVDFDGGASGYNPERDRVYFNGHLVPTEFLTGENNVWKLNSFNIPIEWINFPSDPGEGNSITKATNTITIDIDTANSDEVWCTSIDWACLNITVTQPVLTVHGILYDFFGRNTWDAIWKPKIEGLGLPYASIDMGDLDSIQNNAGKISNRIDSLKKRWGIDTLNIVSHSKGGLDSRDYIEGANTVGTLVQLGTPNEGSPLANLAQAGSVALLGIAPTAIIDSFAAPAGIQLTTWYMSSYNHFHVLNPQTKYVSLGGNYRFGGLGIIDAIVQGFYGGENDVVVPLSSVHALNNAQNVIYLTFSSSGNDKDAQHTSLTNSSRVYDMVKSYVTTPQVDPASVQSVTPLISNVKALTPIQSQNTAAAQSAMTFTRTATIADTISQGQTKIHTLYMEGDTPIAFTLYHGTGELNLALVSPTGVRIDQTNANNTPGVEYTSLKDMDGFRFEIYGIEHPQPGNWTLEVTAPSVTNTGGIEPYCLNGYLSNTPIQFSANSDKQSYHIGDPIIFSATLRNASAPIVDAQVTAKVALPDDSTANVTFVDDGTGDDKTAGDGIYTGRLLTAQTGIYRARVLATGPSSSPFSREQLLLIPVSISSSSFTNTFSDTGNDTDSDGLFNELDITADVNVSEPENYRVFGQLTDNQGTIIGTTGLNAELTSGIQQVTLRFDGERIYQSGSDGPYTLSIVRLAEDKSGTPLPLDERLNAHTTAAYTHGQFQRSAIYIPQSGTDQGTDTNGNGLFDRLDINLDVDVIADGLYSWSGRLVDQNGTELGFTTGSASFTRGINIATFSFDGNPIGKNGVGGPYLLKDVLLYSNTISTTVFNAYTTKGYKASEFEGYAIDKTPPSSITDLQSTIGTTWLNWTWTNPTDQDFNHTEIFLNGIFNTSTSAEYFNATGLKSETSYTISTRTVDSSGNVNETWVNSTVTTDKEVSMLPVANFNSNVTEGYAPLAVQFTDNSTGGTPTSWAWDFGDGTPTSAAKNTTHTYTKEGVYTVTLTVTNAAGEDTLIKTNYVTVVKGANFSASPDSGNKPLNVTFTDLTEGNHSCYWDFGDGIHAKGSSNPTHTYTEVGKYHVTLTVRSLYGTSEITKDITVTELPDAAFEATPTSGNAPLTVTFTDKSENNPTSWAWDFGDGATSDKQNLVHTYSTPGDYTVTLTVSNDGGKTTDEETTRIHVGVGADFSANKTSGNAPLTVAFTDKSTGTITGRLWNFGDGASSKQTKNPVHTYKNPGIYDAKLTITCADGSTSSKVVKITVTELVADFTMDNNGVGYAPFWVKFMDTSKGATAWNWDFGDGTTSTKQSPIHQYTKDGTYTVTLKVSNANGGGLYESKTATVGVAPQKTPDADFDSNVSSGIAPLDVKFTDKSTNSPTDWVWNFGDGATSTDHNPVHTYKAGGTYKVTLTASNAFGSDSVADFITVDDVVKLAADFSANTAYAPLTVAFTDKSTGNPTKWAWNFGDNSARVKTQNPTHKYSKGGTYTVKLTVTNAAGATASKFVKIVVPKVVKPVANFTASSTSGKAPLTVTFTDTSKNAPTSWKWVFGDGKISTEQNPVHKYTKAGTYKVKLTVSNAAGTKTLSRYGYIVVS